MFCLSCQERAVHLSMRSGLLWCAWYHFKVTLIRPTFIRIRFGAKDAEPPNVPAAEGLRQDRNVFLTFKKSGRGHSRPGTVPKDVWDPGLLYCLNLSLRPTGSHGPGKLREPWLLFLDPKTQSEGNREEREASSLEGASIKQHR